MKKRAWLLALMLWTPIAFAQAEEEESSPVPAEKEASVYRSQDPLRLALSFGSPAPSLVALNAGLQINPSIEVVLGAGYLGWISDLDIWAYSASVRISILPHSNFTPILGAGLSLLDLSGRGKIQNLDASTFLGSLLVGVDASFANGLRLAAGMTFHYPISLNFPFVDAGFMF